MEERLFFLLIAVVMIILIPLVPRIIQFRIKLLRMLKWNCLADFHGKNFVQLVMIARIVMALIIIYMMVLVFIG
jgi:hypothetical protein